MRWYTGQTAFWEWDWDYGLGALGMDAGCCVDGLMFPAVGFWNVGQP